MWHMLGDAMKLRTNEQRQIILDALKKEPQTPQQIAKATKMKLPNVQKILQRMYEDGFIAKEGYGQYHLKAGWQ